MEDVRTNYGQGRMLPAEKALAAKMIDRIMPFDELLAKLRGGSEGAGNGRVSANAEMLRLRHEHAKQMAAASLESIGGRR